MSDKYSEPPSCCTKPPSVDLTELKLYQAFIFSIPIFFTFILLLFFYLFYLRRRRVDWASLRMRTSLQSNDGVSRVELGLKKELREMLPIIIYKESFSVRDTQCSVCLVDYEAVDKLQQIPVCGHTFHMDCIDRWLATHTTCPLCRLSLLALVESPTEPPDISLETSHESSTADVENSLQHRPQTCDYELCARVISESRNEDARVPQNETQEEQRFSQFVNHERELGNART